MIKLETTGAAPTAACLLKITSAGQPAVVLSSTDAWKREEEEFVADTTKRKQVMAFLGEDGRVCELIGAVPESACVEMAAAYSVVVSVSFKLDRRANQVRPVIVRVVEVWSAKDKCLWRAPDHQPASAQLDDKGQIKRVA